ncbi:ribosomal protein S5 domain 2-type protein [Papiliotrema laurentii]|uniref:Ribosomal RNA-processing protein 42 n=1 Tax=Papiliotrema laurentii TaxID=5418 RepID=A0AAD9CVB4_PAPLA|nr:ribosomal protein S5 domain 2-type protein [Papiliotrema laurentii]
MATLSPAERTYIISGLSHPTDPTRLDGRTLLTPRSIEVSYGDAPQASGSARVILGGATEVVAGIRLEVQDIDTSSKGKGKEGWRAVVEVDVTPQAYPQLKDQALSHLSTIYASIIADHFIPSLPALPIVPPTKYFVPHLHLTLLSASSGSPLSALFLAARSAFIDLKIPRTKQIGWEGAQNDLEMGDGDLSGIKAALKVKGKGKVSRRPRGGDDWDLDREGDGEDVLDGREDLPVLVTLNLVPGSDAVFIDATPEEETACPDRIHLFFKPSGKICGIRTEGPEGLEQSRLRPLLEQGQRIAGELAGSLNAQVPA